MNSLIQFIAEYANNFYEFDGAEEDFFITDTIRKFIKGNRVLDLGCGFTPPIFAKLMEDLEELVAVDSSHETFDFIKENPNLYERKLGKLSKARTITNRNYHITFLPNDALNLPSDMGEFDSIMQIGCFGTLKTEANFFEAVAICANLLKPEGTLLMMNWLGNGNRPDGFNSPIDEEKVYLPSLLDAGFQLRESGYFHNIHPLRKKAGFTKMIWAVASKIDPRTV